MEENPDNLDAIIQFAFLNQKKDAIKILEKAELRGNVSFFLSPIHAFSILLHVIRTGNSQENPRRRCF